MLTTSVNDSGFKPINEYELIKEKYNDLVDKIYDTNEVSSNISSTVISIMNNELKILREGSIKEKDILNVLR